MFGAVRHSHSEIDFVAVIQMELVDRDIGDFRIVDENAVVVDDERF